MAPGGKTARPQMVYLECLLHAGRNRVPGFVGRNFGLVLQCESDVVQAFEQAMAGEVVDLEGNGKAAFVLYLAPLKIDGDLVIGHFGCATGDFFDFRLGQHYRQHSILRAVIGKNVGKRRSDHRAKTEILQRPYSVFAGRSATEILAGHKNASSCITRLVQREGRIWQTIFRAAPIVKQKLAKAGALNSLEELLGNDLVGIDVSAMERSDLAFVDAKGFHNV